MTKNEIYLIIFIVFWGMANGCSKNLMPPEAQSSSIASGQGENEIASSESPSQAGENANENTMNKTMSSLEESETTSEKGIGEDSDRSSNFIREEDVGELDSSGNEVIASGPKENSDSSDESLGQSDKVPFSGRPFEEKPLEYGTCAGDCMVLPYNYPSGQELARTLPFKETSLLQDVHFKFDRYDLDDESRQILRRNASYLKANSSAAVEIQGHCDERGTNNYNIALGERRSHSTKMYLVSQGISARRIHTISYGEERPACFDSKEECWFMNRRTHFRINE